MQIDEDVVNEHQRLLPFAVQRLDRGPFRRSVAIIG
jgi:hypothetical protein